MHSQALGGAAWWLSEPYWPMPTYDTSPSLFKPQALLPAGSASALVFSVQPMQIYHAFHMLIRVLKFGSQTQK